MAPPSPDRRSPSLTSSTSESRRAVPEHPNGSRAPLTPAETHVWRSVLIMGDLLRFRVSAEVRQVSDLSPTDHSVLLHLDEAPEGRVLQQRLATSMFWSKSRLSHQLTRMQARGLIERTTDEEIHGVWVSITEAGSEVVRTIAPAQARAVRERLFALATEEELTTLVRLADRLIADHDGGVPYY